MTMKSGDELEELDIDRLDEVHGGGTPSGHSFGVYASIGSTTVTRTSGYTVAVGLQTSFPYVTGGIYSTTGTGLSTGVSTGGSAGVFAGHGKADDVFTGPSNQTGLAFDAMGKLGSESSSSPGGATAGVTVGIGMGLLGVQSSAMHTETASLTPAIDAYLNPTPGHGAPGDTYVPASTNPDGSTNPGHFEAPQPTTGETQGTQQDTSDHGAADHTGDPTMNGANPDGDPNYGASTGGGGDPNYGASTGGGGDPNYGASTSGGGDQSDNTYGDYGGGGDYSGDSGGGDF